MRQLPSPDAGSRGAQGLPVVYRSIEERIPAPHLLFRWLVGVRPNHPIWHPTTFSKNHKRLLNDQGMGLFLDETDGGS